MTEIRRRVAYQAALFVFAAIIAYSIFAITRSNLERLGVHSGFDFLFLRAGFEIGQSLIAYSPDSPIVIALVVAFLNTLLLAVVSIVLATALGFVAGLCRLSGNWLLSRLALVYVETFRSVPALLQIFFWYFVVLSALPDVQHARTILSGVLLSNRGLYLPVPAPEAHFWLAAGGLILGVALWPALRRGLRRMRRAPGHVCRATAAAVLAVLAWIAASSLDWIPPEPGRFGPVGGMSLSPEFVALALGLAIYNATYIAEIVRSSVDAVPRALVEAAGALGLGRAGVLRHIQLPLAARIMVPPLTTVHVNIFKSTSLAAAIAYPDVMSVFVGTVNNLVGQPLEIMAVTFVIYTGVSLGTSLFLHWYGRRHAGGQR